MSTTGLEVVYRTLHKTNVCVDKVMEIVGRHRQDAYAIHRRLYPLYCWCRL